MPPAWARTSRSSESATRSRLLGGRGARTAAARVARARRGDRARRSRPLAAAPRRGGDARRQPRLAARAREARRRRGVGVATTATCASRVDVGATDVRASSARSSDLHVAHGRCAPSSVRTSTRRLVDDTRDVFAPATRARRARARRAFRLGRARLAVRPRLRRRARSKSARSSPSSGCQSTPTAKRLSGPRAPRPSRRRPTRPRASPSPSRPKPWWWCDFTGARSPSTPPRRLPGLDVDVVVGEHARRVLCRSSPTHLGEVLDEVAPARDVQDLRAAADGEHRHVALERRARGARARRASRSGRVPVVSGCGSAPYVAGSRSLAAGEDEAVERVERLLDAVARAAARAAHARRRARPPATYMSGTSADGSSQRPTAQARRGRDADQGLSHPRMVRIRRASPSSWGELSHARTAARARST